MGGVQGRDTKMVRGLKGKVCEERLKPLSMLSAEQRS